MLERIRRWFTGPPRAELEAHGMKPDSGLPPLVIDPPIPYKKGRTEALWDNPKKK